MYIYIHSPGFRDLHALELLLLAAVAARRALGELGEELGGHDVGGGDVEGDAAAGPAVLCGGLGGQVHVDEQFVALALLQLLSKGLLGALVRVHAWGKRRASCVRELASMVSNV